MNALSLHHGGHRCLHTKIEPKSDRLLGWLILAPVGPLRSFGPPTGGAPLAMHRQRLHWLRRNPFQGRKAVPGR